MKLSKNQQIAYDIIKNNEPISEEEIKQLVRQINPSIKSIKDKILRPLLNFKHAIIFDGLTYCHNPSFTLEAERHTRAPRRHYVPLRSLIFAPIVPTFAKPVTLYEYSYEYLILQTASLLGVSRAESICIIDMYLSPNVIPPYTFEAFLEETVQSFQTASRNINVINYLANKTGLNEALFHYDLQAISNSSVQALFDRCARIIGEHVTRSEKTWKNMLACLKDNAEIMSRFDTPVDYHNFLENASFISTYGCDFIEYQSNTMKTRASLDSHSCGIKGFGSAITPNYLKEIGYNYGKPDTHLISIASYVPGWLPSVPRTVVWAGTITPPIKLEFETGLSDQVDKARKAGFLHVNEYVLDKILWLICSGFYYKHRNSKYGGGANRLKPPFIHSLDNAINAGIVIP